MTAIVKMAITPNAGYSPDQAENDITLGDLLSAVEDAIERFGEEAKVVTIDAGNRYGASWGHISDWEDMFTSALTDVKVGDYVCSDCYDEHIQGSYTLDIDYDTEPSREHHCDVCGASGVPTKELFEA